MRGLSRYENTVVLRYGTADTAAFTRQAHRILQTRIGGYRGYGVTGSLIVPVALDLADGGDPTRLGLRISAEPHAGTGGAPLDLDAVIEPDAYAGLRLAGLGPVPLPLRRGTVDAVRCATLVFGLGDIDSEGPTAEFGLTVRSEAGLQCAYACGTLHEPYAPRWEASVRSAAVAARDRGLPASAAVGQIAAHCLA